MKTADVLAPAARESVEDGADEQGRRLVSISRAHRETGLLRSTISLWLRQGRVKRHGTGPRRAVCVSLVELEREMRWLREESLSARAAGDLLHMEDGRVIRLCEEGELPFRRFNKFYEVSRQAVEILAAEREARRGHFRTFSKCLELYEARGLTARGLDGLIASGVLVPCPGERAWTQREKLIDTRQLEAFLDADGDNPHRCPHCGDELPPGLKYHGECASYARVDSARLAFEEAKGEELVGLKELEKELDRSRSALWRHVGSIADVVRFPGRGPGGGAVVLTPENAALIRLRVEESPEGALHRDPTKRAAWYWRRFESTAKFGRLNRELAEAKGRTVGAPVQLDPILEAEVEIDLRRGDSQRQVAQNMSHKGVSYKQVRRIARRLKQGG